MLSDFTPGIVLTTGLCGVLLYQILSYLKDILKALEVIHMAITAVGGVTVEYTVLPNGSVVTAHRPKEASKCPTR